MLKKKGIPFLVLVPLLSHIVLMLPHNHLILDLTPRVIPKDYVRESRP